MSMRRVPASSQLPQDGHYGFQQLGECVGSTAQAKGDDFELLCPALPTKLQVPLVFLMDGDIEVRVLQVQFQKPLPLQDDGFYRSYQLQLEVIGWYVVIELLEVDDWPPGAIRLGNQKKWATNPLLSSEHLAMVSFLEKSSTSFDRIWAFMDSTTHSFST